MVFLPWEMSDDLLHRRISEAGLCRFPYIYIVLFRARRNARLHELGKCGLTTPPDHFSASLCSACMTQLAFVLLDSTIHSISLRKKRGEDGTVS